MKTFLKRLFVFALSVNFAVLLPASPAAALSSPPTQDECRSVASQVRATEVSLKKVESKLKQADRALTGLRKQLESGARRFDRDLARSSQIAGDLGSEIAGVLAFAYVPENPLTLSFINALPIPAYPQNVLAQLNGTLLEVYDLKKADFGRRVIVEGDQIGGTTIVAAFSRLALAANDTRGKMKVVAKVNQLASKIYRALNKRAEKAARFHNSPIPARIAALTTPGTGIISTLETSRATLLAIRGPLLNDKIACEAAGL